MPKSRAYFSTDDSFASVSTCDTLSLRVPVRRAKYGESVALSHFKRSVMACATMEPLQTPGVDTETLRRDYQRKHRLLVEAVQEASRKLGCAHPLVESATEQIKTFRSLEEGHRWRGIVNWHAGNVTSAVDTVEDGGSLGQLEDAITLANDELGGGHRVVLEAKAKLLSLRKKLVTEERLALEDFYAVQLKVAILSGDLDALAQTIAEASDAIGSSHPIVEISRDAFKSQRAQRQRADWAALVHLHEVQIAEACQASSLNSLHEQIVASTGAVGLGHPLVQAGKDFLLQKKKSLQHDKEQMTFYECCESVSSATAGAEAALMRLLAETARSKE